MVAIDKKLRDEELAAVQFMMGDRRGRAFMWRLLGICGLYQSVLLVCPEGIRPEERGTYNAARQDVAQGLHTEIFKADPTGEAYRIMMSEAHARKLMVEAEKMADKSKPREQVDE